MPSLFRSVAALAMAGAAFANPLNRGGDACLAAVTGKAALGDDSLRIQHCSSFIKTIVTPAAITVTTTITDAPSSSGRRNYERDVTVCPNEVPNYASACNEAGYKSACSVFGVTGETTFTIPATTTTKTVYAATGGNNGNNGNGNGGNRGNGGNGGNGGICTSTSTSVFSVTRTGCSGGTTTSTVTQTAAASTVTSISTVNGNSNGNSTAEITRTITVSVPVGGVNNTVDATKTVTQTVAASTITSTVGGNSTVTSTVSVGGNSTATSTVTVGGNSTVTSTVTVGGNSTATSTVTVGGNSTVTSTVSVGGNSTVTSTVSACGNSTAPTVTSVSTVTANSTAGVTTTVTVTASSNDTAPFPTSTATPETCLTDAKAREFVDAFETLLEFTSYAGTQGPPGRGYKYDVSEKYLAVDFKDYSDSINWMAGFPLGGITFDGRQAFDIGQGVLQPELAVETLLVSHSCKEITWKWHATTPSRASVIGINHMIISDDLTQIKINHAEFDNAAWLFSFGLQCKTPTAPATNTTTATPKMMLH